MMATLTIYLRKWQRTARRWLLDSRLHAPLQAVAYLLCGFLLSAASLVHHALPLSLGLLFAASGLSAALLAAGSAFGYWIFWGQAGVQGLVWMALGLPAVLLIGSRRLAREQPGLMCALAAVLVAFTGLGFQLWLGDDTPVGVYLLRVGLAPACTWVFRLAMERRDPVVDWLVGALGVLALAQAAPAPWLNPGYIAAGALTVMGPFPAAALAGLSLDLAQVTHTPMTAALSLGWLMRLIPGKRRFLRYLAPPMMYLAVMALCGHWDLTPAAALLAGSLGAMALPGQPGIAHRRGETGSAQVRLEMAAGVLRQTGALLEDVPDNPIDEEALLARAVDRACGSCPCRKNCREKPENLPTGLLHRPLGIGADLPLNCRKSGRMLQELRRSQEQLRSIRADRDRQAEYRQAVVQQYSFLSEYLQDLSDLLAQRGTPPQPWYQPQIGVCSASLEQSNGDRCLWFAGTECRYYILLCDGMGTGAEAARDAQLVADLLRRLLAAGLPGEYALRSVNSLCALQGRAGAVTLDLAELHLDTGKVTLYKWGAAPSYLISGAESIRIGTATPPPGLSVLDGRERVERLSLRRGETLILFSDGAGGEESLRRAWDAAGEAPGELARRLMELGREEGSDDATVAVVRLNPAPVTA